MNARDEISKTIQELHEVENALAEAERALALAEHAAYMQADGKTAEIRKAQAGEFCAEARERVAKIRAERDHLQRWYDALMALATKAA